MSAALSGRVAIVTGGASGIGQASAWALAEAGAIVFAADVDPTGLGQTVSSPAAQDRVRAILCDVTSETDVRLLVSAAEEAGGLDIAVNCAGILQSPARFDQTDTKLFERLMRVNTYGVWLCMQHEVGAMLKRGKGSIVNVASAAGLVGVPMMHAYTATKHAVVGLTRSVGFELAGEGIRVNAVCPGATSTPMTKNMNQTPSGGPGKRMASACEIAAAIRYLATDESSYITAAAIAVDNGFTAV